MNLYDVRLLNVRAQEIQGAPFVPSDNGDGYQADLNVEIVTSTKALSKGSQFDVSISMATMVDENDPFFSMTMIGTFEILADAAVSDLAHPNAPYELGSLLYPYVRNLTKPILEYLGARSVDLPFAPPSPPPSPKKKAPRKKRTTVE